MKAQLKTRLDQLNQELENGQQRMQQLDVETTNLRHTLLRISGAIQVLEEELARADREAASAPLPVESNNHQENVNEL